MTNGATIKIWSKSKQILHNVILHQTHESGDLKTTFADETQVNSGIEQVTLLISLHVAAKQEKG